MLSQLPSEHKNYDRTLPQLVSYPRTGSHWVRLVLEQYLNKYCLPTTFFDCDKNNYWGYHLHDRIVGEGAEGITGNFDKVIYLYRSPVDTIFSQVMFDRVDFTKSFNNSYIEQIMDEYYDHLERWLFDNDDIKNIIFVKYEDIKSDPVDIFSKILAFLNYNIDKKKLEAICKKTTIKKSKEKTSFDSSIINRDHFNGEYDIKKKEFTKKYKKYILSEFLPVWK